MGIQNQNYESARARNEAQKADYAAYLESPQYLKDLESEIELSENENELSIAQSNLAASILKDEYKNRIFCGFQDDTQAAEELLGRLGIKNTAGQEALTILRDQGAKIQKIVEEFEAKNAGKLAENGEKTPEFFNNWPKSGAPENPEYVEPYKEYKETGNMKLTLDNYFQRLGIQYPEPEDRNKVRSAMYRRRNKERKFTHT